MFHRLLFVFALSLTVASVHAQYGGPRLFLDVPAIYFTTPDVLKINDRLGAGAEVAMNVATHWGVVRAGGGATYTLDPQSNDFGASTLATPYFLVEAGAGKYRSNGNKCAKTHRPAFTAMAKAGVRYDMLVGNNRPDEAPAGELDYTVGVEFGYFYIRDIFKNYEMFARSNYFIESQTISAELGLKVFLNLRADRD